jgi:pimeloyl-ACP methyl ester carboxylesterase
MIPETARLEIDMHVDLRGVEIAYDTFGQGEPTLVLLHAFPLNRHQWEPQAQAVAQRAGVRG